MRKAVAILLNVGRTYRNAHVKLFRCGMEIVIVK
uniref:Uncharacterized protein n=1 Tax=Anguilla anguilla TaxID=7936 RepID=A0A0E9V1H7_ANGAN